MEIIQKFQCNELNCQVECVKLVDEIWFRGKDIAKALGYSDTMRAVQLHVEVEDKKKLEELRGDSESCPTLHNLTTNQLASIYINESGLYSLILQSHKPEAKQFKNWVTHEVLPALRQNGTYTIMKNTPLNPQIKLINEYDLHVKVIGFIRRFRSDAVIVPGLGEMQRTSGLRHEAYVKGYLGGQPDILVLNHHCHYSGLAIELKTQRNWTTQ